MTLRWRKPNAKPRKQPPTQADCPPVSRTLSPSGSSCMNRMHHHYPQLRSPLRHLCRLLLRPMALSKLSPTTRCSMYPVCMHPMHAVHNSSLLLPTCFSFFQMKGSRVNIVLGYWLPVIASPAATTWKVVVARSAADYPSAELAPSPLLTSRACVACTGGRGGVACIQGAPDWR